MHGSWVDFLCLINFIITASTENAKTDIMILFAWYCSVYWIKKYPTYGSVPVLTYVWGAPVFCRCGSSMVQYHTHKSRTLEKFRSTMMPSRPRLGFAISQQILLLFLISDKRRSPYKRAQLPPCSDSHGKEKPLSSPSQEIVKSDVRHHRIPAIREEEQGHF